MDLSDPRRTSPTKTAAFNSSTELNAPFTVRRPVHGLQPRAASVALLDQSCSTSLSGASIFPGELTAWEQVIRCTGDHFHPAHALSRFLVSHEADHLSTALSLAIIGVPVLSCLTFNTAKELSHG